MNCLPPLLLALFLSTAFLVSNLSAYQLETRQKDDGTLVTTLKPTPLTNDRGVAFLITGIVVFFISYFALKLIFQYNNTGGFWDHEEPADFIITGVSIALGIATVVGLGSL